MYQDWYKKHSALAWASVRLPYCVEFGLVAGQLGPPCRVMLVTWPPAHAPSLFVPQGLADCLRHLLTAYQLQPGHVGVLAHLAHYCLLQGDPGRAEVGGWRRDGGTHRSGGSGGGAGRGQVFLPQAAPNRPRAGTVGHAPKPWLALC